MRWIATLAVLGCACGADILNNQAIHTHVDELVQREPADARPANRVALDAALLVPIAGTYALDRRVFGNLRPSAIVFDWILGAIVPAALVGASFAVTDASARAALRWSALGLYGGTRIGIEVIGNLHIDEYDRYLAQRSATTTRVLSLCLSW